MMLANNDNTTYAAYLMAYVFEFMEPTDRAVRPYGDVCPPEGPVSRNRGSKWGLSAVPGDAPWDGVSEVTPEESE